MDFRAIANEVLRYAAWLNLAAGVVVAFFWWRVDMPAPTDAYGVPTPGASVMASMRLGWIVGSLFGGVLGWAICYALAEVSREVRELHHEITRAMR